MPFYTTSFSSLCLKRQRSLKQVIPENVDLDFLSFHSLINTPELTIHFYVHDVRSCEIRTLPLSVGATKAKYNRLGDLSAI